MLVDLARRTCRRTTSIRRSGRSNARATTRCARCARRPSPQAPQHARELEQRRVAGRVVADALVPGVVVAVDEQELVGILLAADLDDRQQAGHPAFAQPRLHRRTHGAALHVGDQRLAVRMVDAHDRRRRLAADRLRGRRAPDGRADAFVDALPGMDVDLRDRAAPLERLHRAGHREAFGEHDAARRPDRRRRCRALRRVRHVEEARRASGIARRHVADLALDRRVARRARHRRRTRVEASACQPRSSSASSARSGRLMYSSRRVQRHRHAERLEPVDDVAAGGFFCRRARLANERRRSDSSSARGSSSRIASRARVPSASSV